MLPCHEIPPHGRSCVQWARYRMESRFENQEYDGRPGSRHPLRIKFSLLKTGIERLEWNRESHDPTYSQPARAITKSNSVCHRRRP